MVDTQHNIVRHLDQYGGDKHVESAQYGNDESTSIGDAVGIVEVWL